MTGNNSAGLIIHDQPVEAMIQAFTGQAHAYAYSEVMLLGVLLATRKLPVPEMAPILRHVLDEAAAWVNDRLTTGAKPVICSELVYRCYSDAQPQKYGLSVRGVDLANISVSPAPHENLIPFATLAAEASHLAKEASSFLATYLLMKGKAVAKDGNDADAIAVADFVTPHDLEGSPNLFQIGRLGLQETGQVAK